MYRKRGLSLEGESPLVFLPGHSGRRSRRMVISTSASRATAEPVINEIIAVFMAKKGFEWAGELGQAGKYAASAETADAR